MDIKLISQDGELLTTCRAILAEIAADSWTITAVSPHEVDSAASLCIWDFQPGASIPEHVMGSPAKHLFLVRREDLELFRLSTHAREANILLKPYTRATLAAFLGMAISVGSAISLRADRDAMLQCLIQTNLRLQEYDQDRTSFLARAVHDFRAPLTALSGYCGLLLGEPLGPLNESQTEVLQRMQHSATRLLRMANAMFELSVGSRVERQNNLQKGDIRVCLDQALHEIAPFSDEKRLSIDTQFDAYEDHLYFDAGQIEQVFINILDNACKFAPKSGSIEIRGYPYFWERRTVHSAVPATAERRQVSLRMPNCYRVDISDSGSPIAPEHLQCIFEEYTTYSAGRDRSGGGLGLAICRSMVNQHHGRIWAENTEAGPMISFVLPFQRSVPHLVRTPEYQTQTHVETCNGR
jgi:signal transduction histidine kinase